MNIYTLKDQIAKLCAPPFFAVNDDVAVRSVEGSLQQVPYHQKKDLILLKVGTFDEKSGVLSPLVGHQEIDIRKIVQPFLPEKTFKARWSKLFKKKR